MNRVHKDNISVIGSFERETSFLLIKSIINKMASDEEDQVENEPVPSKKEKKGKGKGKGKGKKKKKKEAKLPKGMIANANGELMGVREYTLQQA